MEEEEEEKKEKSEGQILTERRVLLIGEVNVSFSASKSSVDLGFSKWKMGPEIGF